MAGFGVQFHLIIQDFSQLKAVYGDGFESFIANCGYLQVFGVRDLFTARYISDMLGMSTVWTSSQGYSTGGSGGGSHSKSVNEVGRPLMTVGEILTMPHWVQLIFPPSAPPILAGKHLWYAEEPWKDRGRPAPDIFKPLALPPRDPIVVHGAGKDLKVGGIPAENRIPAEVAAAP